jgi:hypothetical protein
MNKIARTIETFKSKACCKYTQYQANVLFKTLCSHLTEQELFDLNIVWSHSQNGEGNEELFSLCKDLISKYNSIKVRRKK